MRTNEELRKRMSSAFTLVEMLLVMTIIGILAAVVVAKFGSAGKDARIKATRASIQGISTAVETYEIDCGVYPPNLQALVHSTGEPNWKGPYVSAPGGEIQPDPWGTPFSYTPKENDFEVRSAGPDKAMGSSDDITN
jgi:general secretion pathway protein G